MSRNHAHVSELPRVSALARALLAAALFAATGCTGDDGDTGPAGPPGTPGTDSELEQGEDLPGLEFAALALTGGTAPGGRFRAGDKLRVNFRLEKSDGSDWDIAELSSGRALVSGPTFNYQRVIAEQTDLLTAAVEQPDGSYTYAFTSAIPATYLPPLNDSPAFGPDDGELTGALLEGTYTLAMTVSWDFTVDGESERDSENVTLDFVIGNSGVVEPRQVVKIENCNRCHDQLRIHGGRREEVTLCVLCHTSGAEDEDGVAIDFRIMIHKIHSGENLPSVQGLTTDVDGSRIYGAGVPYVVGGHDYSHVVFPAWPHAMVATPRDAGYTALSSDDKLKDEMVRKGPSNCAVCHGDPDGDEGPLSAPSQGDLHLTQPTRGACGSCHDDLDYSLPYVANTGGMPDNRDNASCKICHVPSGDSLAVLDGHLHPLKDPAVDTGVNLEVTNLAEAGTNDPDGTFDPGEKIAFDLRLFDDADVDILPSTVSSPSLVIAGPTSNYNLLLNTTIPTAALAGPQPFSLNVPMLVQLERIGVAGPGPDTFSTAFDPHWNLSGATTSVLERTDTVGGDSTLAEATVAPQNYVDVLDATGFDRDDYIVVDDGSAEEEYVRIQFKELLLPAPSTLGRLWFSSPASSSYKSGLALAHPVGSPVREVTLTARVSGTDYGLDAAAGDITEMSDSFGDGNTVIASYTTDFVVPTTYPLPLNAAPGLGEADGEWAGKELVDGTYTLSLWTSRSVPWPLHGETNTYRVTSDAAKTDFLVGSATVEEPYALISSGSNCFNCHQELAFHGFGRRGFDSCVVCHGSAGGEDRPRYVAGGAPETPGVTVSFRTMLHKIHMGEELANASSYQIVGHGSASYPNNFGLSDFAEVLFPALPGGVQNCTKCHGNDAWHEPLPRNHPTDQSVPTARWAVVCGACHDSSDAQAHIAVQTDALGNESCGVCHGQGKEWNVERVHRPY